MLPYEQLNQGISQAIAKQQQEEQLKAQILQALGFFKNDNPFGAIPHGAGIMTMDNQAYVRPGGVPQPIQQLLESLLGVNKSRAMSGLQDPRALSEPGGGVYHRGSSPQIGAGVDQNRLAQAIALHKSAQSLDDVNKLYNMYPQEMEYLLGGGRI